MTSMSLRTVVYAVALTAALPNVVAAQNQRNNAPVYYPPGSRTSSGVSPNTPGSALPDMEDADHEVFAKKMLEARKVERKKRMVDTANRLLVLTEQLQTDLRGREATPDDQKRLDEIARLARVVKDQMRN